MSDPEISEDKILRDKLFRAIRGNDRKLIDFIDAFIRYKNAIDGINDLSVSNQPYAGAIYCQLCGEQACDCGTIAGGGITMIYDFTTREAWLELRKPVITSTEISALFGLSPYMTALELALLKRGEIDDAFQENDRTRWGTRLQDSIAGGIAEDYGILASPLTMFITADNCRIGASFDWHIHGINDNRIDDSQLRILFGKYGNGLLEIKNVDSRVYRDKWTEEESPAHIELQLQHQLECSGRDWGVIAALVGGNTPQLIIRERDRDVGRAIRTKVNEFWSNLEAGILPPASMPQDADTLRRLYNYSEPGKLLDAQNDTAIAELCREYKEAGDVEKSAKDKKDVARAHLLERIGDAEKVIVSGYTISAGMIGPADISYTRPGYRDFRIFKKKEPKK